MKPYIKKILTAIIALVIIVFLLSKLDKADILLALGTMHWSAILWAFGLIAATYIIKALRFKLVLKSKISTYDMFLIANIHNLMLYLLPARGGELSYLYLVRKRGVSFAKNFNSLFLAYAFDFISVILLFFLSLLFIKNLPQIISGNIWIIGLLLVIPIIGIFLFVFKNAFILTLVRKVVYAIRLNKIRFFKKIMGYGKEVIKEFRNLKSKKTMVLFLIYSLSIWILFYIAIFILVRNLLPGLSFWIILAGATLTMVVQFLPFYGFGGFGLIEGMWTLIFMAFGVSRNIAIISGFSQHIVFFVFAVVLGLLSFIALNLRSRDKSKSVDSKRVAKA